MAEPRYTYDPVTQTYTLQTPEQAFLAKGLYDVSDGGDFAPGDPGQMGAGGTLGALGLAGMAYGEMLGGMAPGGTLASIGGRAAADIAMDQEEATDKANAAANAAGVPIANQVGFAGTTATTDPGVISGLAGLAATNAAQNAQSVADAQNAQAAAAAAQAAQDVADVADTTDAEAGAANAAAAAASTSSSGGGGDASGNGSGDSPSGPDGGPDGDPTNAGDSSDDSYFKGGRVMNYAQGGVASAQHAQSMGRGQDTMLVHMTPGEVGGLQALAKAGGGSLTVNPKTGLYEAGFLSSMLPMVAGAALTGLTGGVVNPMTASLLVGGAYGAATGSLKKGLMAGLGAFGGANIATGLGAAGAEGIGSEVVSTATPQTSVATGITPEAINAMPAVDLAEPLGGAVGNMVPTQAPIDYSQAFGTENFVPGQAYTPSPAMGGPAYAQPTVQAPIAPTEVVQAPPPVTEGYGNARDVLLERGEPVGVGGYTPPQTVGGRAEQMFRGAQNVFSPGEAGTNAREAFMTASGGLSNIAPAAAPIVEEASKVKPVEKRPSYIRRYDVDVVNRSAQGSEYAPGSTYERRMMDYTYSPRPVYQAATGGLAALAAGGEASKKKSKKIGGDEYYKFADSRQDKSMEAALEANFASGGQPRFLSGGGDGMSDSIPANIDGKQEARLADGEFVVPADVVSHLGNGSSKAGAKKLYKMMDRIREARTGKKSQAPEVKAERHMPA